MRYLKKQRFLFTVIRRSFLRLRPGVWRNFIRYRLTQRRHRLSGPDRLPYTPPDVFIWATSRCNGSCDFCQFKGDLNRPDARDLALDRFQTFLRHRLVRNAFRICLFGGEPLLNTDAFAMVRAGHEQGHLMTMNTNGTLLGERASELVKDPPDMLTVSYYPENRDVLADGIPRAAQKTPIYLHYTYSRERMGGILEAAEFAAGHGVRALGCENLYPTGKTSDEPIEEGDAALAAIKEEVDKRYGRDLLIKWLMPRSRAAEARQEPTVCRMLWNRLMVDMEGRWTPCCAWARDSYQGSLLEEDDAWNSARMQEARSAMRSGTPPAPCQPCDWLYDELMSL